MFSESIVISKASLFCWPICIAAAFSAGSTSRPLDSALVETGAVTRALLSGCFDVLRMPAFLPNYTFPLAPPIVGVWLLLPRMPEI